MTWICLLASMAPKHQPAIVKMTLKAAAILKLQ